MKSPMKEDGFGTFKNHFHTILTSLSTAAILFCASYVYEASKDQAVMTNNVVALTAQIGKLEAKLDQLQSNYVTRIEFKDHEDRLRRLEKR